MIRINLMPAEERGQKVRRVKAGKSSGGGRPTIAGLLLPLAMAGHEPRYLLRDVVMTLAWVINAVFAEWLIGRKNVVPAAA